MNFLRSIVSILSAPLLYGMICVPTLGILYSQLPHLVNEQGGSRHVPLLLGTEFIQFLALVLCGYVTARLAPRREWLHTVIAIILMLTVAVNVQLSFWDAVPFWHHFVFFASIVVGMSLGARLRLRGVEPAPVSS